LAHDVTERKRAQEALVTESARLRVMLEQMPAVLWTTDCGLRITSAAGTGLAAVGEKPANTVGRPLADFVRPRGDDQRLMAAHQRALAGEPVSFEDSWHKRTFQAHVEPLREAGGRITGVIGLALDVTDAKRAEEEHRALERRLQEAQKLESLGVLAGGIAHDFNNLLAAILGNVSLANMQLAADAPVRPYLQSVEVVAQRAAELCKQMLAYAGRGRFVVQLINVNTIINEMANLLRVSIGKGVNLRFDLAPALPLVSADATQIRQVVMNLILNASEAVGDRTGAICLSTGLTRMTRAQLAQTVLAPDLPDGDYAFLEVTDTGCGMDAETLARIFDPFFSTKFTGRGLGLAAVLGIVRGHRGAINVESTPGRGSTFRVCLPCGPVGPPELPAQAPARPRLQGTILLVDDDETLRTVEARLLEANGLRVLLAGNGREGIEVLKAHAADVRVVLLDMGMPGLSTEETYRAMEDVRPGLPMVLLSGYDQQERASQRGDRARTRFLQKPCPPQALLDALTALMAGA
jgi:PAS domain S-box-containing protein